MNVNVKKSCVSRNWKMMLVIIGAPIIAVLAYIGDIAYQLANAPAWAQQASVQGDLTLYGEDLGMHGLRDIFGKPENRKTMQGLKPVFAEANQKAEALREQGIISTPASTNSGFYNLYFEGNNRQSWRSFAALTDETQLGVSAPDFDLETIDGNRYRLSDHNGKIRVFMMAAVTCQPAMLQVAKWSDLQKKYNSDDVEFVVIYSVERHAGEDDYPEFSWPTNYQEKMAYARIMGDYTNMTIAVDDFDAKVLRTYGNVPNPAYVVDQKGRIVFRSSWADSSKIEYILDEMVTVKAEETPL